MPLNEDTTEVDTTSKGLLVGTIVIQNENKPKHQPVLNGIGIEKDGNNFYFRKPTLINETDNVSKEYIFSMESEPGAASLTRINFFRSTFPINAMATLDLNKDVQFVNNQIIYIGNIKAKIVPRKEGQPRAGSLLPLIDQAVAGFSTGTFEVEISDNYEEDVEVIKSKFPYLQDKDISKNILSEWSQPEIPAAPTETAEEQ